MDAAFATIINGGSIEVNSCIIKVFEENDQAAKEGLIANWRYTQSGCAESYIICRRFLLLRLNTRATLYVNRLTRNPFKL